MSEVPLYAFDVRGAGAGVGVGGSGCGTVVGSAQLGSNLWVECNGTRYVDHRSAQPSQCCTPDTNHPHFNLARASSSASLGLNDFLKLT